MRAAGALWPLVWRPAMLWLLFPLFWVVFVPLALLWEQGSPEAAGGAEPWIHRSVLALAVLVPATLGGGLSIARLELQHTPFSFTLPDLRRRLLIGTAAIGLATALVIALAGWWQANLPIALAAFGVSGFWFAAGSAALDVGLSRGLRYGAILVFVLALAAFARGPDLPDLTGRWAAAVAAVALTSGFVILTHQFSRQAARVRPFRWSSVLPDRRLYWSLRRPSQRSWSVNLATSRIWLWIRAADYETSVRLPSPARQLVTAAFAALLATLMNLPQMAIILIAVDMASARLQLRSHLLHPLSRQGRARVAFAGLALEAAVITGLLAGFLLLAELARIPPLPWFAEDHSRLAWPVLVGFAWAWAPVAQAPAIGRPLETWEDGYRSIVAAVAVVLWAVVVIASAMLMPDVGRATLLAAVAGTGVVTHAAHWLFIRWHFRRRDLVG